MPTILPLDHPVHRARRHAGLTLRVLGRRARISYQRLHAIEHGLQPRPDELARLAAILDVDPNSLRLSFEEAQHAS